MYAFGALTCGITSIRSFINFLEVTRSFLHPILCSHLRFLIFSFVVTDKWIMEYLVKYGLMLNSQAENC
jgi:hypothetical protein